MSDAYTDKRSEPTYTASKGSMSTVTVTNELRWSRPAELTGERILEQLHIVTHHGEHYDKASQEWRPVPLEEDQ